MWFLGYIVCGSSQTWIEQGVAMVWLGLEVHES